MVFALRVLTWATPLRLVAAQTCTPRGTLPQFSHAVRARSATMRTNRRDFIINRYASFRHYICGAAFKSDIR